MQQVQVPSFQAFINDKKSKMSSSYPFLSQEQIFLKLRKMWKEMDMTSRQRFHKSILQNKKAKLKLSVNKLSKIRKTIDVYRSRGSKSTVKRKCRNITQEDCALFNDDGDTVGDVSCDSPYMKNKLAVDQLNLQSFATLYDDKRQRWKGEQQDTDIGALTLDASKYKAHEELGRSRPIPFEKSRPADQARTQKTYSGRVFELEHRVPDVYFEHPYVASGSGILKTQSATKTRPPTSVSYSDLSSMLCKAAENIVTCDPPDDQRGITLEQNRRFRPYGHPYGNQDINSDFEFNDSPINEAIYYPANGVDNNATGEEYNELEESLSEDSFFVETENTIGSNATSKEGNSGLKSSSQRRVGLIKHPHNDQSFQREQFPSPCNTSTPVSTVGGIPHILSVSPGSRRNLRSMSRDNSKTSSLTRSQEQKNSVRHNHKKNGNTGIEGTLGTDAQGLEGNSVGPRLRLRKSVSESPKTRNESGKKKQSQLIKENKKVNENTGEFANLDKQEEKGNIYGDRFDDEDEQNAGLLFRSDYATVNEDNNFVSIKDPEVLSIGKAGTRVDSGETRTGFIKPSKNLRFSTPHRVKLMKFNDENLNSRRFSSKSEEISNHNNVDDGYSWEGAFKNRKHEGIVEKEPRYNTRHARTYPSCQNPPTTEISNLGNASQNVKKRTPQRNRRTTHQETDPKLKKRSNKRGNATPQRVMKTQPALKKRTTPRRGPATEGLTATGQEYSQEMTSPVLTRARTRAAVWQASLTPCQTTPSLGIPSNSKFYTHRTQETSPVSVSQMKDCIKDTPELDRRGKKSMKVKEHQLEHQLHAPRRLRSSKHQEFVDAKNDNRHKEAELGNLSGCSQMIRDQPLILSNGCRSKDFQDRRGVREIMLHTSPGRKNTKTSGAPTLRHTPRLWKTLQCDKERSTCISSSREPEVGSMKCDSSPGYPCDSGNSPAETGTDEPPMDAMFQDIEAHSPRSHEGKLFSRRLMSGSAQRSSKTFQTLFYDEDIFM